MSKTFEASNVVNKFCRFAVSACTKSQNKEVHKKLSTAKKSKNANASPKVMEHNTR
jgi:hypothetical protein